MSLPNDTPDLPPTTQIQFINFPYVFYPLQTKQILPSCCWTDHRHGDGPGPVPSTFDNQFFMIPTFCPNNCCKELRTLAVCWKTTRKKGDSCLFFPTACQPCPHGWRRFKSNCYLFEEPSYSYHWKNWEGSRDKCKEKQSDLVVIDSLEEQARPMATSFFRDHPILTKAPNIIMFENVAVYCCSTLVFAVFSVLLRH